MTREQINAALDFTGIPRKPEAAVPVNGQLVDLPYMVTRTTETVDGSDNGLVRLLRIEWQVALFTTDKSPELNGLILKALAAAGKIDVGSFPDGSPYQTTFKFKTTQIL